jgi:hypothetical protein
MRVRDAGDGEVVACPPGQLREALDREDFAAVEDRLIRDASTS